MFELKSQLFEENLEVTGGGGNDKAADSVVAAPVTLEALKSLFGDFQTNLLKNVDSKINSINKEVKTQNAKLATDWSAFKDHVSSSLHPVQEPDHDNPEPELEPEPVVNKKAKDGQQEPRDEPRQPEPKPAPQKSNQSYRPTPREQSLDRQLREAQESMRARDADMKKRIEAAEKKETESILRTEISKHKFNSPRGQEDLFDLLLGKVERDADGAIWGPQGSKLDEWVLNEYQERPFFHPAKPVNGSGAGNATGSNGSGGFDIDKIGPNMSAADEKAVWAAIQSAYKKA